MHPALLAALVAERHRDLAAMGARRAPRARRSRRVPALTLPITLPRFRVCWTRVTLAAAPGSRRGRSVVIVISATRTS